MVSTPNRPVFSPGLGRGEKPTNPFHVEELDAEQLHDLLAAAGLRRRRRARRCTTATAIAQWEQRTGAGIVAAQVAATLDPGEGPRRRGRRASCASVTARRLRRRRRPTARRTSSRWRWRRDRHRPEPVGTFCLVLHTHLPWLAHHGAWPVGEEWLHQAWATSYLPVLDVLERLAAEGRRDLLTLGVTPVRAAQLDDPLARRRVPHLARLLAGRAPRASPRTASRDLRELGSREFVAVAARARGGRGRVVAAGCRRCCARSSTPARVELLGGPATHPFQPLLDDRWLRFALRDRPRRRRRAPRPAPRGDLGAGVRLPARARGATTPTSASAASSSTARRCRAPAAARREAVTVGDSDVVAFARDLEVTYRVWSPRKGYPGGRWYRDFHTFDHGSGFRPARVTSTTTPVAREGAVRPGARGAGRCAPTRPTSSTSYAGASSTSPTQRDGRPGLVVAAYDTELFGHWWHEGPQWLEAVLRAAARGRRARHDARRRGRGRARRRAAVDLGAGSWGSGKDWRVWDGEAVADLVDDNARLRDARAGKVLRDAPTAPAATPCATSSRAIDAARARRATGRSW